MAVTPGRNLRLYGWNAYEWPSSYRYVPAGWTCTPTPGSKSASVVVGVPTAYNVTGAKKGVMWNVVSGQGYDRRTRPVDVAAGALVLLDLQPGASYYLMPVCLTADGQKICGPETGPMVMS
jgi:hypothetical protein